MVVEVVLWKPYVTLHACYISAIDRFLWSGSGIWLCLSVKLARVMSTNASTPRLTLALHTAALGTAVWVSLGSVSLGSGLLIHSQRPGLGCAELCKHRKEQCLFQRTAAPAGLQTFHVDSVKFGNDRWLTDFYVFVSVLREKVVLHVSEGCSQAQRGVIGVCGVWVLGLEWSEAFSCSRSVPC